jgi:hypothetical protein
MLESASISKFLTARFSSFESFSLSSLKMVFPFRERVAFMFLFLEKRLAPPLIEGGANCRF